MQGERRKMQKWHEYGSDGPGGAGPGLQPLRRAARGVGGLVGEPRAVIALELDQGLGFASRAVCFPSTCFR